MAVKKPKPNIVEIRVFKGKKMEVGKSKGKVLGGIVQSPVFDNSYPIVWLGDESYTTYNVMSKKNTLYYDSLAHRLFRPAEMGGDQGTLEMLANATQNFLVGAEGAKHTLGVNDQYGALSKVVLGAIIVFGIIALVFLYLFYTHIPIPPGVTAPIANHTGGSLTNVPQIVPLNGSGG